MIDTKKARELRAKGTQGKWEAIVEGEQPVCYYRSLVCLSASDGEYVSVVGDGRHVETSAHKPNAEIIAYAVSALDEWPDEIDRLRAALRNCRGVLLSNDGTSFCDEDVVSAIAAADALLGDPK